MFSGNEIISDRQLYRNYGIGFVSLSALLAPLFMGQESIWCVLVSLVLLGSVFWMMARCPLPKSRLVKGLCMGHYWIMGTLAAHMTGRLIQEYLLGGIRLWMILIWFYGFCFYNIYKGSECRIRVSEILFLFFLVLLVGLSLLMLGEVEAKRLLELRFSLGTKQLSGGYQMFAWFSALCHCWYLKDGVKGRKSFGKTLFFIWLFGSGAAVLWGLFSYCIYGNAGHTGLIFPLASAMTLAHLPGNVMGRMDALFVFAWVMGLFILCSTLFSPLGTKEPDGRGRWLLFASLAASFLLAVQENCLTWGLDLLYKISTPIQVLLLVGYWLFRGKKGLLTVGMVCLAAVFVQGCGHQELEERSMVSAIGVDVGTDHRFLMTFQFGTSVKGEEKEPYETECGSLKEAEKLYYDVSRKHMDFNHLKNFYFSEALMGEEQLPELLEEIQKSSDYSRGVCIYVTQVPPSEAAKKEEQPKDGTPIHRLLNAWYNTQSCELSKVDEEGMYRGNYLWP